ncbi:hypothetical protein D9756_008399 [Leucocoprinus leucothites]|uniref:Protein kinase domain-containing protein n=1 Tax=Leucocoprinus leucothites TaxID=201217 RepID=A0A8H5FW29_9AGAR|nr:hypothetical protein D9756_008399 [Leucoagaricus leucothites]
MLSFADKMSSGSKLNQIEETEQYRRSCGIVSRLISQDMTLELKGAFEILQGDIAQTMVEFLNKVLGSDHDLPLDQRRRLLHLFTKIIKSAQVYPKSFLLTGVMCSLAGIPRGRGGGFGEIFVGKLKCQPVGVKVVHLHKNGTTPKEILRAHAGEFALWAHMSHPNVLPFYGVCLSKEGTLRICIVSPWMEAGSLAMYPETNPTTPQVPLLIDMASGLQYMHGLDIIHCDLKVDNILVSDTGRVMLADFGLSVIVMTNGANTSAAEHRGTTNWIAPECLAAKKMPPPT